MLNVVDSAGQAKSRKPSIMADACEVLIQQPASYTSNFCLDEILLRMQGVTNFEKYRCDPNSKEEDLMMDFFLPKNYWTTQKLTPNQVLNKNNKSKL